MEVYSLYILIGALAMGFITGLIDLIYGLSKNNLRLGIIGFMVCIIAGFLLGAILAIPVCILFIWLIRRDSKKKSELFS